MKTIPILFMCALVLGLGACDTAGPQKAPNEVARAPLANGSFNLATARQKPITVAIWISGSSAPEIEQVLLNASLPASAVQQVLFRSRDGSAFIELTSFADSAAQAKYSPVYIPKASTYWRRDFAWKDAVAKDSKIEKIDGKSNVQWSEFTLRNPKDLDTLYEAVGPMVATMTAGAAPTLPAADILFATNQSSIAILGFWSNKEGFEVFEREATFGKDPYWGPYADNAHWMLEAIAFR